MNEITVISDFDIEMLMLFPNVQFQIFINVSQKSIFNPDFYRPNCCRLFVQKLND